MLLTEESHLKQVTIHRLFSSVHIIILSATWPDFSIISKLLSMCWHVPFKSGDIFKICDSGSFENAEE